MNAVATKLRELRNDLTGELILPPDPGYDDASKRTVSLPCVIGPVPPAYGTRQAAAVR